MRARLASSIVVVSVLAAACDRPPEPQPTAPRSTSAAPPSTTPPAPRSAPPPATTSAPPAASSSPPAASGSAAPKRCIVATPDAPPAPVAKGPDPACPVDAEGKPPKVPMGKVTFPDAKGAKVEVELMKTEKHRERGLMFRRSLADDRGMLFVFPDVDERGFWMRNTCLPLDMIFLDADGTIVSILENVPTMNDAPRRSGCPAKYVLEVNAGWARKHGVKAGQTTVVEDK